MKIGDIVRIIKPETWEGVTGIITKIDHEPNSIKPYLVHFTSDTGSKWASEDELEILK